MQEEGKIKKERWGKPKLIVLMRGRPEERVLGACKTIGFAPVEPTDVWSVCARVETAPVWCDWCLQGGTS